MAAPTHTPPHPASRGGVDIRLPWWALVLPTLAFVVLLTLILNPSDAHAASGDPAVTRFLEHVQQLTAR
ncbi:hypothetical protein AB0D34_26545 [Streptomyces sp. NPDC048420]|uniref:hypothetical protein n=1 Tax=Streptomyces sp. NPDC048420 TaxID=3155755 RepID=UPI003421336E